MADVYTVTFILIGILICVPGLLVALNLLLPTVTKRVQTRLTNSPGRCFWFGVPVTAAFLLFIAITANIPVGPVQAMAWIAAFVGMGVGSIGGAGLSRLLADRLAALSTPSSELTHLVRGAVVYELACLTPVVGWFLFIPLMGITLMGSAVLSLVSRGGSYQMPAVSFQPVSNNQ